ncbi:MAG: sugar phosphate isomerase/epimerase [Planctomycetaceae bacterium]|nr:sugar phosphate isomerase/epimerase [Planctomycetaceae bacterium]MBQ2822456.1 sugar phosphate isomerase/epimerase [Thermoguttaceae bacterium]
MFLAATTNCFRNMPLSQALEKIADLEYSHVELMFHESNDYLKPSYVQYHLPEVHRQLKNLFRLTPSCFSVEIDTEDTNEYVRQFVACVKLARAMQVVTITLRAAPWGFPFNSEVERLRKCMEEADKRGIVLGLLTERERLTEDIETARSLCSLVPGLNLTLDPSHYVFKYSENNRPNFENIMDLVCHVRLRDTKEKQFQVCVGQGEMEFGQIIARLQQKGYRGALSVDILPEKDLDVSQEMRKMRLLLESLL